MSTTPDQIHAQDTGLIQRYREFLPVGPETPVISLNEGSTPLIPAPVLSREVGRDCQVFIKYEGLNPTGSFKDRGMTMAMSKAAENGVKAVICASTGNTSAAAAAYAARAGLACIVLLPAGKIAKGKLAQALVYGARVVEIEGNFDEALELVRKIGERDEFEVVNSINPFRIEGQKTASFEIIEALGDAPDYHILPVGNAGNITAYWKGYVEFAELGKSTHRPRMMGFQAAGAAPLVHGQPVDQPETIATAIRIGHPASWEGAMTAITDSNGSIDLVTDDQILEAQRWLASNEGIFVEPASAASIAGLRKCLHGERCATCPLATTLPEGSRIVCTVTGHGLKDSEVVLQSDFEILATPADEAEILRRLDL
ncbi:MAG: threonine synthase [Verrucomicrobiota bacterium]